MCREARGKKLMLNLPFVIPSGDSFPFVGTLDEKLQEAIWLAEHAIFVQEILEDLRENQQVITDNLRIAESDLKADSDSLLDYLIENDENEFNPRFFRNEVTEEVVVSSASESLDKSHDRAVKRTHEIIMEYQKILANPTVLVPEYFWEAEIWTGYHRSTEESLLAHLVDFSEYQAVIDRYHVFYGRDPENERAKSTHRANWSKAQELANTGKTSMLQELQKLSVEAETAVAAGKRITSQDGDCYVCGKFIPHFGGELIIWNEIPREYFYGHLGGKYQKWRVRHFSGECSLDKYGKRIQLVHIKGHTGYRNERADKCWLCEVDVAVDAGWLVLVDQIPKWKRTKRAFPGAKPKKYYVQCEKNDEDS